VPLGLFPSFVSVRIFVSYSLFVFVSSNLMSNLPPNPDQLKTEPREQTTSQAAQLRSPVTNAVERPVTMSNLQAMFEQLMSSPVLTQRIADTVDAALAQRASHVTAAVATPDAARAPQPTQQAAPVSVPYLAAAAPVALSNAGPRAKIATPDLFHGNLKVNVTNWLFEMDRYLNLSKVTADAERVQIASAYLKGLASQWWQGLCQQQLAPLNSWDGFIHSVTERFQPIAASKTARAQLKALQQGPLMSVAEYTEKFNALVQLIPDMNQADQVQNYVDGLRRAISFEVDKMDPTQLYQAQTLAQKAETRNAAHRLRYDQGRAPYTPSASTPTSSYTSIPSSTASTRSGSSYNSSPVAMELGNLNLHDRSTHRYSPTQENGQAAATTYPVTAENDWTEEQEQEYHRYLAEGDEYEPQMHVWENDDYPSEHTDEEQREHLQAMQQRRNKTYSAPFMPREELQRCRREGLCLRCKKPGHIARQCSLPRTSFPATSASSSHFGTASSSAPQAGRNFH
jgi:hypothetical protein